MNALKDGRRSKKRALALEDSYAFENRRQKWMSSDDPRDDQEEFLAHRKVFMSFELDRARLAHVEQLTRLVENSEDNEVEDVYELGKRLFFDPCGPTSQYGNHPDRCKKQTSWDGKAAGPNAPDKLVRKLESSAAGCLFMREEWEDLRARLEPGKFWQSPDRFKATRLLGQQPVDAVADRSVALIFVASHALHRDGTRVFDDLLSDMKEPKLDRFRKRVKSAWPELFLVEEPAEWRQVLVDLVEQQIERLNAELQRHEENADAEVRQGMDRMGVDRSKEGTLVRNYFMKCSNALERAFACYEKHRGEDKDARMKDEVGTMKKEEGGRRTGARRRRTEDAWREDVDLAWAYEAGASIDRGAQPGSGTGTASGTQLTSGDMMGDTTASDGFTRSDGATYSADATAPDGVTHSEGSPPTDGTSPADGGSVLDSATLSEGGRLLESSELDSIADGDEGNSADVSDLDAVDCGDTSPMGRPPTAACGGTSPTRGEENDTNEANFDEAAIITEHHDPALVMADSGVALGLDNGGIGVAEDGELEPGQIGNPRPVIGNPLHRPRSP